MSTIRNEYGETIEVKVRPTKTSINHSDAGHFIVQVGLQTDLVRNQKATIEMKVALGAIAAGLIINQQEIKIIADEIRRQRTA